MTYIVSARKWRPMVFEDVVGQEHVTTTLRNAILMGRLSHAYIFSGQRGVGKTTTARILAKAINCLEPLSDSNPDNACELCQEITEGRSLNVFEIDGASSRGVDDIRNLRDAVRYGPSKGKYKVYIIDEVHMLTKEAFNALLKTLEEPPPYILFIFATTEIHKVPLTILSRCQRFEFHRITIDEIIARLNLIAKAEKIDIEPDALMIIAKKADGSMRDAQSIFDQLVSYCGNEITAPLIMKVLNLVDCEFFFRLTELIISKDTKSTLLLVQEIIDRGYDLREFIIGLNEHFRNLLIVKSTDLTDLIEASEIHKKRYKEVSNNFTEEDILRLIKIASDTDAALRWSQQPRYKFEIAILQMVKMDKTIEVNQLIQEINTLKKRFQYNETQIYGNVKASQPPIHSEQKIPDSMTISEKKLNYIQTSKFDEPFVTDQQVDLPTHQTLQTNTSFDEIQSKWQLLVRETKKQRVGLGSMLDASILLGASENRIKIGCPDDMHLEALKRNREFLTDLTQRVYGAKIKLETILIEEKYSKYKKSPSTKLLNHPVIQALIREFGAEITE